MAVTPPIVDRRWLRLLAAIVGLTVPFVWLWTTVTPSEVTVRIRNGLGATVGQPADFNWTPDSVPSGYLLSKTAPPAEFTAIAGTLRSSAGPTAKDPDFEFSLAVSRDLMRAEKRIGTPVRARALPTYRAITEQGRGYCADFVKAFNAIAIAGDVPVRQWGLAFTAFGSGHTFNEIYDRVRGKWLLVDSFHSLYFADPQTSEPLSTIEVHDRLLSLDPQHRDVRIVPIVPGRLPFRSEAMALDYYRVGMRQLWLVWGNNALDFEKHHVTGPVSRISRGAGQLIGLVLGQYPTIRIYPTGVSERDLRELYRARDEFFLAIACCGVSALLFGPQLVGLMRRRGTASHLA
jgi:hypothetical protein